MNKYFNKNGVLGSFTKQQYNGNIGGMIWKSKGDGEKRKYDFDYDAVNRLMKADFNQFTSGTFNKTANIDFSVSMGDGLNATSAYDANGNIKAMSQKGLKINSSPLIDQLSYTYQTNSNKLSKVVDAVVDKDSKLGDFKYDPATKVATDYSYDGNGNLISDANKKITSITYNYLNLPSVITVTGNGSAGSPTGTITYTYDAAGNKLKKVTVDNTVVPSKTTTTLYIGGAVYENDVLQFVGHEEGRIRPVRDVNNNITSFAFDYFLKDHLGNVRMVLTEEQKTDQYPPASMETAQATTEEALYANLPQTRVSKPSGYPTDNYTNPNNNVAKVNGSGNIPIAIGIGPSIILKVMAGDKFNIRVSSWYKKNGATPQSPNSIATDLVTGLINSLTVAGGPVHGAITSAQLTTSGVIPISTTSFLNSQPAPGSTKPKAYINWVLLDEQFKFVSTGSGAEQVGNDNTFTVHVKNDMPVSKTGYLYIFVSNETPNIDVFFDNLEVIHNRGQILEENHYYSYGLKIAAISSKAAGALQNNSLYQGDFSEYDEDAGYNEFYLRHYDAQIGRWTTMDPKMQYSNPYLGMKNYPVNSVDVDGGWGWAANTISGAVAGGVIGGLISKANGGEFWEGATIGGIYGADIGAAASYGLNLNGIQDATNNMAWNIASNALLTASINLTTKLLEGNDVKSAAISGLIGLGTGSLTALIRGKKYQGNDPEEIRKDEINQYKSEIIGNSLNGFFDRLSLSRIQGRKNPLINAFIGFGEGLLSGIGTGLVSQGGMSSFNQNLLSSFFTATPGLSVRTTIAGGLLLATGIGALASEEGDWFERLSPGWNRLIGIGILGAEYYIVNNPPKITSILSEIDYPDYFKRF